MFNTVKLLWQNLYYIKRYRNKADLIDRPAVPTREAFLLKIVMMFI